MAATETVAQGFPLRMRKQAPDLPSSEHDSSVRYSDIRPRHGVITLSGFGLVVRVDRGHLLLEDGVAGDRRRCRLPRVGHGLKRLVVIGSDGHLSLAALRWLADQDAAFSMVDRDGKVLATTGPVRSYDAKLRRAQAMALHNGAALKLSREIIDRKLAGQEQVALQKLGNETAAHVIRQYRSELAEIESLDAIRLIESHAAKVYWSAWSTLSVTFPRKDLARVPEHWRTFDARVSPLTSSPRLASNPVNAVLNYLYAILEAETRLAIAILGLDPGLGVLHVDTTRRDSLACDVMEPIRPDVDAFVLDWIKREPLSRSAFFEQRDGNCRLMDSLTAKLSETATTWARLVAPIAEWFAGELLSPGHTGRSGVPARLTQRHRRLAKGAAPLPRVALPPQPSRICHGCAVELRGQNKHCKRCGEELSTERMPEIARIGRLTAHSAEATAKRAATQRVNMKARWDWESTDQPSWLTEGFFCKRVQPLLASLSGTAIAKALNVSRAYANDLRKGRIPHPRHWRALSKLTGETKE